MLWYSEQISPILQVKTKIQFKFINPVGREKNDRRAFQQERICN